MTDISILPQPVRDAVAMFDKMLAHRTAWPEFLTIRADLLRVYAENAASVRIADELRRHLREANVRAEQAEAELERVRAKIESAPVVELRDTSRGYSIFRTEATTDQQMTALAYKRVRLVADDAKEG
jgi:hypothetical protein